MEQAFHLRQSLDLIQGNPTSFEWPVVASVRYSSRNRGGFNMAINSSVSLLGLFTDWKDKFPYPFCTSTSEIGSPFHSDFVTNSYGES